MFSWKKEFSLFFSVIGKISKLLASTVECNALSNYVKRVLDKKVGNHWYVSSAHIHLFSDLLVILLLPCLDDLKRFLGNEVSRDGVFRSVQFFTRYFRFIHWVIFLSNFCFSDESIYFRTLRGEVNAETWVNSCANQAFLTSVGKEMSCLWTSNQVQWL